MARVKLLVTTGDFSKFIVSEFHYLLIELSNLVDLTVWHESGDIHEIVSRLDNRPDFIFINEFGELNSPSITGLKSLDIPYGVYLYDLHFQIDERIEALRRENVQIIFTHYRDKFYEWYGEFSDKMRWLPQHVNTNIFKNYSLRKDIDFLLMGAVHEYVYPLRQKMLDTMRNKTGFVYHGHPGYRNFEDHEREHYYVGKKYAQEINRAKMFLTDSSCFNYPVGKYFEVPGSMSLLLAPTFPELEDLGFIPGENFVSVTEDDLEEKAEYYLSHEREREIITKRGYEFVHSEHSTIKRAKDLVRMIEDILSY